MSNASLYAFLSEHCRDNLVLSYLEIGTRDGDSLRIVVENAPELQHVTVCDLWGTDYGGSGRGSHAHIDRLLAEMLCVGDVEYLDGDSRQTVPTIRRTFDLVLVDGDHSRDGAMADLENTWPLVAPGGALAFHDITHPAHPDLQETFDTFRSQAAGVKSWRLIVEPYGVGVMVKR